MKRCIFSRADLGQDVPGRLRSLEDTEMQNLSTWSLHEEPRRAKGTPVFRQVPGGGIGLKDRFDVVSIQFAIHYMMKNKTRARRFFRTVSQLLDVGGILIATTMDARVVLSHLMNLGLDFYSNGATTDKQEKEEPVVISVGSACEIKFERRIVHQIFQEQPSQQEKLPDSAFGLEYSFLLIDNPGEAAVDRPEWLTPLPILVQLAREVGLELEYAQNFHNFYHQHSNAVDDSHKRRLWTMKVLNHNGTISQEEWNVSRLYLALQFRKVREIE